jgi:hypothetical protein
MSCLMVSCHLILSIRICSSIFVAQSNQISLDPSSPIVCVHTQVLNRYVPKIVADLEGIQQKPSSLHIHD